MKESGNYVQCLHCGNIYKIERKVSISASIIKSECPDCGYKKGLNCGNEKEEIYRFYDPTLDKKYY